MNRQTFGIAILFTALFSGGIATSLRADRYAPGTPTPYPETMINIAPWPTDRQLHPYNDWRLRQLYEDAIKTPRPGPKPWYMEPYICALPDPHAQPITPISTSIPNPPAVPIRPPSQPAAKRPVRPRPNPIPPSEQPTRVAAVTRYSAVSLSMDFLEKLPKEALPPSTASGGLVGNINRIAQMIAGAGAAPDQAGARADVSVEPRLEVDERNQWIVKLSVSSANSEYDPLLTGGSKAQLQQELAFLGRQLGAWSMILSDELKQQLVKNGSLSLPVSRPLSAVRKWRHGAMSVTITPPEAEAKVVGVRFYAIGRSGVYPISQLIENMPAFAEVIFDKEPREAVVTLEMNGGAGTAGVRAVKLGDQPTIFRTGQFVPSRTSDGLDVPPPVSGERTLTLPDPGGKSIPRTPPAPAKERRP